eukprot:2861457-Amphidinium_carterae.1
MSAALGFIDSPVVFQSRALELGLSQQHVDNMAAMGIKSFGDMAFSAAFASGTAEVDYFVLNVAVGILGVDANEVKTHAMLIPCKRLFHESQVNYTADQKRKVEGGEPRKLFPQERATRLAALKKELQGIVIDSDLEPSHALLDKYVAMREEGCLRFMGWASLTSRAQEMHGAQERTPTSLPAGHCRVPQSAVRHGASRVASRVDQRVALGACPHQTWIGATHG